MSLVCPERSESEHFERQLGWSFCAGRRASPPPRVLLYTLLPFVELCRIKAVSVGLYRCATLRARAGGAATFSSGRLSSSGTPDRLSLLPARAAQCPASATGTRPNKGSQACVGQLRPRLGDLRAASRLAQIARPCSLQKLRSAHTVPPELPRAREARLGFNGCGRGAGTYAWTPRLAQKKVF